MARHALVNIGDFVVNIIELDPGNNNWTIPSGLHPDHPLIQSDDAQIDDLYDPGTGQFAPPIYLEAVDQALLQSATDFTLFLDSVGFTATNVSAAPGALIPFSNHRVPTFNKRQVRFGFICSVANPAVKLALQWFDSGSWETSPEVECDSADGLVMSPVFLLPKPVRNRDVEVRAGIKGNGILDPIVRKFFIQVM